jgi:TolB-like protein/Flp pilus assembly protein TadD
MTTYFTTGGTLKFDAPSYVEREADRELFQALSQGEFCYVLTSRQMGKSSLMVRTANRLRAGGAHVPVLDLTAIGLNVTPEQWYDGLLERMGPQIRLEDELEDFWLQNERLSPVQRFFGALRHVALSRLDGPLLIFIDEIDAVRSLPFSTDEFFAAIRETYNRRPEDPELQRLAFCLLGVATPSDLMRDTRTTPFNIGVRIELSDFAPRAAGPLAIGLGVPDALSGPLLERVFHWTHGHPYLTQRLCRAISESTRTQPVPDQELAARQRVDRLCEDLFLSPRAREQDDNLLFVRERILRSGHEHLGTLLNLYEQIRNRERVRDDESNFWINQLRLAGITRVDKGLLVVRNRIYHRVFDEEWIRNNRPEQPADTKSIAVLPFLNTGSDPEAQYLSEGLTEDLVRGLSQVEGLRVAARTSGFVLRNKTRNIRKIAERFGVSTVLEGSVRQAGQRLRITVQLVSAADGFTVWSERYDRDMSDVFAIQDEIPRAIVEALKHKWGLQAPAAPVRPKPENSEAYQFYLKGRHHYHRWTEEGFHKAIEFFEQAIAVDPDYPAAHSGLADANTSLLYQGLSDPAHVRPTIGEYARKALDGDPGLAPSHTSNALRLLYSDWDWRGAEAGFRRALELDPNYITAREHYALWMAARGRLEEAIAESRRALELDSLSLGVNMHLGMIYWFASDFDAVIDLGWKMLDFQTHFFGTHWLLGLGYWGAEMAEESVAQLQRAVGIGGGPLVQAALGHVLGRCGERSAAIDLLNQMHVTARRRHVPAACLAAVQAGLGEIDLAFASLERAIEERNSTLLFLNVHHCFAPLRPDPRFIPLLARVGLSPDRTDPTP